MAHLHEFGVFQHCLLRGGKRPQDAIRLGLCRGILREVCRQQFRGLGGQLAEVPVNDQGMEGLCIHKLGEKNQGLVSSRSRTAATALCRRDLTVPNGMPNASAISA